MDVSVEKSGPYLRKLSVAIPAGDVDKAYDAVYREYSKKVSLPGFRPGKAPRGLVEKQYGHQIEGDVRERLVSDTLFAALDQEKQQPVAMPKVQPGAFERGKNFAYTAEFEVAPEIELKKYKGLPVSKFEVAVDATDVDEELEQLRKQSTQLVPVKLRDIVENGDVVVMDYVGTMGGAPINGAKGSNALIEMGGEGYLPGFAEGIMGAKVGTTVTVHVDFPADYGVKELAGKPATFTIDVKEIKTKELPKLDDDFAKDLGEESLAALRTKIEGQVRERREEEAKARRRQAILRSLVDANPVEVPPSMVATQVERMIEDASARVEQIMGRQIKLNGPELEALRKDSIPEAEFTVKSGLLLMEVGKTAKIEVPEAEVSAEVEKMAEQAGQNAERFRTVYQDPRVRERLSLRIQEEKTIALLLEHAVDSGAEPTNAEGTSDVEADTSGEGAKKSKAKKPRKK